MTISLESAAFAAGKPIPVDYTGDGKDRSPPLSWSDPPARTRSLALVMDDPDAPTEQPWVHWVLYSLPGDLRVLPEGLPTSATLKNPPGAEQGRNSWNTTGYRGPAPPRGSGVHHYHFTLYALDAALDLELNLDKASLLEAIDGHVLARGELVGTYQR